MRPHRGRHAQLEGAEEVGGHASLVHPVCLCGTGPVRLCSEQPGTYGTLGWAEVCAACVHLSPHGSNKLSSSFFLFGGKGVSLRVYRKQDPCDVASVYLPHSRFPLLYPF